MIYNHVIKQTTSYHFQEGISGVREIATVTIQVTGERPGHFPAYAFLLNFPLMRFNGSASRHCVHHSSGPDRILQELVQNHELESHP